MKKALIAGAASTVLAAMPVMGVFAAVTDDVTSGVNSYTDTIQTTVPSLCSFARATTAHTGTWTTSNDDTYTGVDSATVKYHDILTSVTITAGANETTLGSSSFLVHCNNFDGYQVTFTAEDLVLTDTTKTQTYAWEYTGTGAAAASGSYWYLTSNGANAAYTAAGGTAISVAPATSGEAPNVTYTSAATPAAGTEFTITYNAKAVEAQDTGTYDADIVYTFAQL